MIEKQITEGKKFTLDNLHLVCMENTLEYKIRRFEGIKNFLLGEEEFAFEVKGTGKMWIQTCNSSFYYSTDK